ncbi:hypothetical protein MUO74_06690 [Candidatus Bathyarchaeota archaeon]|jgi:hypothetical protein|nr:hypothetical protein [Candidatus Bathyarchaeota archaeon]
MKMVLLVGFMILCFVFALTPTVCAQSIVLQQSQSISVEANAVTAISAKMPIFPNDPGSGGGGGGVLK